MNEEAPERFIRLSNYYKSVITVCFGTNAFINPYAIRYAKAHTVNMIPYDTDTLDDMK